MELDAAKRCFSHLKQAGLKVDVFVSDRHKGIGKWIWTEEQETQHFNDIWHVNKGINKVLRKTSKEKGCEIIGEWTKGIRNHLYWCVQSTQLGFGELIVAKWQSTVQCGISPTNTLVTKICYFQTVIMLNLNHVDGFKWAMVS